MRARPPLSALAHIESHPDAVRLHELLAPHLLRAPGPFIVRIYEAGPVRHPHLSPDLVTWLQRMVAQEGAILRQVERMAVAHLGPHYVPRAGTAALAPPAMSELLKQVPTIGQACLRLAVEAHALLEELARRDTISDALPPGWPLDSWGERLLRAVDPRWTTSSPSASPLDATRLQTLVTRWLGAQADTVPDWSDPRHQPKLDALVASLDRRLLLADQIASRLPGRLIWERFLDSGGEDLGLMVPPDAPLALLQQQYPGRSDLDVLAEALAQRGQSLHTPGALEALCAPMPLSPTGVALPAAPASRPGLLRRLF